MLDTGPNHRQDTWQSTALLCVLETDRKGLLFSFYPSFHFHNPMGEASR